MQGKEHPEKQRKAAARHTFERVFNAVGLAGANLIFSDLPAGRDEFGRSVTVQPHVVVGCRNGMP